MNCRIKPFIPDPFEGRALFIDWNSGPRPSLGRDVCVDEMMAILRLTEEQRPIEAQDEDEELEIAADENKELEIAADEVEGYDVDAEGNLVFDWRTFLANQKSYWLWLLEECVGPHQRHGRLPSDAENRLRQFIAAQLDLIERGFYKLGYDEPSFPPAPPTITFDTEGLSDWELYLESGGHPLPVTSPERGEAYVLRCWKSDCQSKLTVYGDVAPNATYDCERHHRIRIPTRSIGRSQGLPSLQTKSLRHGYMLNKITDSNCRSVVVWSYEKSTADMANDIPRGKLIPDKVRRKNGKLRKSEESYLRFQNTAFDAHYPRSKGRALPEGEMPLVATASRRDTMDPTPNITALDRLASLVQEHVLPHFLIGLKEYFVVRIVFEWFERLLIEPPQMELDDFENRDGWHWTYPFNYLPEGAKLEELPPDPETYVSKSGKKRKHFWTDTGFVKSNWVDSSPEMNDDGDDLGNEDRHGYHGDHVFNPNVKATKKDQANTHHARRKYEGITNMRMEEGAYPSPDFPGSFDKTNREFRIRQAIYAWRHGEYTQAEAAARNAVDDDITAVTISHRWKEIQSGTEKLRTVIGDSRPEPPAAIVECGGPWIGIHRKNGRWYWFPIDYADFMVDGNDRVDAIVEAERELRNRLLLYEIYSAQAATPVNEKTGRGIVKRTRAVTAARAKADAEWAARATFDFGGQNRKPSC